MDQLRGHSITYRIAVGPQQGRKVFTLQTLPGIEEPFNGCAGQARLRPGSGWKAVATIAQWVRVPEKIVLTQPIL
jgi:hypothetical protein